MRVNLFGTFKSGDGPAEGFQKILCPICNNEIQNGVCQQHGTICETCGFLYRDAFCTNCYPQIELGGPLRGNASTQQEQSRLGERGLDSRSIREIMGRGSVTRKEMNILNAAVAEDHLERKIRTKAEAAIKWLELSRSASTMLLQNVEKNATTLTNEYGSQSKPGVHVPLERIISYCLLIEAKKIGRTIIEVQNALAKAGFNVKLPYFSLRIALTQGAEISSVCMYVNDRKQSPDCFKPKESGEGPLGKEYSVGVQLQLSDTLGPKGSLRTPAWIKLHFDHALILPEGRAITNQSQDSLQSWNLGSDPEKHAKSRIRYLKNDPSSIWVKVNSERCFSLFKATNYISERVTSSVNVDLEPLAMRHQIPLPSRKLPASAALMRRALCLGLFERRATEIFRQLTTDSKGRSGKTLAKDALLRADREIYASLSKQMQLVMKSYVSTLPLKKKDRNYTGTSGLLILSELD
jgi:hypothetical protein